MPNENLRKNLLFVIGIVFFIITVKLFLLQIVSGKRYFRLAEANRIRKIYTPAPRGRIFDRHDSIIADSRPSFSISVIPCEMDSQTITNLMHFGQIDDIRTKDWITNLAYLRTPITVKRNIDMTTVLKLEENSQILPGVSIQIEPMRIYSNGRAFAHLVGYLSIITPEEIKSDTFYKPWHNIGRYGIEAQYEKYLRGTEGIRYTEIDASGREIGPLKEKREILPISGNDVCLTIDNEIQRLAYDLVSRYQRAAVVGIDLNDGGIICLVSYPSFDPEILTQGIKSDEWQKLINDKSSPLMNRAITCAYPPGSTIKPLIALAGLESGSIEPSTRFSECEGKFTYGIQTYKCWTKHGTLNLANAIIQSCNSYFYQLGLKIGLDKITSYLIRWGIDEKTGIDLQSERRGNVPTREWLDNRYGKNRWTKGILPNLAIGQGEILVTPLQLALIYGALARDGEYFTPHLLKSIKCGDKIIIDYKPQKKTIPVSSSNLRLIKDALSGVVERGTGWAAYLDNIAVAGKTGTAENPPKPDHAWFVGYAPANNPEVVFCVLVENVGKGGSISAPIVRELIRKYFEIKKRSVTNE